MIRRPPRSTLSSSSAASAVYKRQPYSLCGVFPTDTTTAPSTPLPPPHPIADASISQIMDIPQISTPTSIDALFPRPFAVAEWTPSVLHCGGLSANTHHHRSLPHKAVSYTHLRAHETPEHLVCRLLLEKKKNIQRYNHSLVKVTHHIRRTIIDACNT
eukprot:TRINITY_DN27296_c0_g1_i1.p1 TRINITY_DN27296_c0_g1~~TRINITY_DN27296_c0_g1_i1.p1  ORF type:complete len:158 (-),score=20.21 TRINITY_DN27296_c0_g1_i1:3-476(-)